MPPRLNQNHCRLFNTPGGCRFGEGCRFAHVEAATPGSTSTSSRNRNRGASPATGEGRTANLMSQVNSTEPGPANFIGTGTDAVFSPLADNALPPAYARKLLVEKFLTDDYRFQKTFDVYSFAKLLDSIDSRNPKWSSEDGQVMLDMLSNTNGLLRIMDIVVWSSISTNAGSHSQNLSFQRSYIPLLKFLACDIVTKSTLNHRVNALYSVIVQNIDRFIETIEKSMTEIMARGSFKDPRSAPAGSDSMLGFQYFCVLISVFYEILSRFKNVSAEHPSINRVVLDLQQWVETFIKEIQVSPSAFNGPLSEANMEPLARDQIINHQLQNPLLKLVKLSEREANRLTNMKEKKQLRVVKGSANEGNIAHLELIYDPPGWLRATGPRHDNDHESVDAIAIAPTQGELLCKEEPYLPANFDGAIHHLPQRSIERHLDIQFRLLREELIAPLRTAIQVVVADFKKIPRKTKLSEILGKRGGKYHYDADNTSVMFGVYTNVGFHSIKTDRRGVGIELSCDAPPGPARNNSASAREAYWQKSSGKKLMTGGLIALLWMSSNSTTIELGTITSTGDDLKNSARADKETIKIRVAFFNPQFELKVLKLLYRKTEPEGTILLIESPVLYEAIRPFLEALRVIPESLPFGNHIVEPFNPAVDIIPPPLFAQFSGFRYELGPLFPAEAGISSLKMNAKDPASVAHAREVLSQSRLDPSQADAVLDALCREVALIQGPPGTGKSYTGVELLRVLLPCARPRPILLIAFTNHALDHMLNSILDAGITTKIVRLGSRSADERVSRFSLDELEKGAAHQRLYRALGSGYRALKDQEKVIQKFMAEIATSDLSLDSSAIMTHVCFEYPEHDDAINNPQPWIHQIYEQENDLNMAGWQVSGQTEKQDNSLYAFWANGKDLDFINASVVWASGLSQQSTGGQANSSANPFSVLQTADTSSGDDDSDSDESDNLNAEGDSLYEDLGDEDEGLQPWQRAVQWAGDARAPDGFAIPQQRQQPSIQVRPTPEMQQDIEMELGSNPIEFFRMHDYDTFPMIPNTNRGIEKLLDNPHVWAMSKNERRALHQHWVSKVKEEQEPLRQQEYLSMRHEYKRLFTENQEGQEEVRRQLLKNVDIIGCTTTGAAKLTSLLNGLAPRILVVEEAGQVLEAHIIGSLATSLEHLVLIGDPLQLRPTLNNYSLSVDSKIGGKLYKFDMSLMERLSSSQFPMSRIDVQRRMRPEVSNLLRKSLYPGLIDHDRVKTYPSVRGMAKDVFFLDHQNKENDDKEGTASKFNTFEVEMIKDLVLYLLRQGYSKDGDIVVLCAYLGQLAKVRDALSKEVVVLLDDRDAQELSRQEDEKDTVELQPEIERVKVSKQVRIRTVDNYQGEEATIVILSLVRNAGAGKKQTIGFLRSTNRTNVSLSRAKEGLYILGNAAQLRDSGSDMWRGVVKELENQKYLGDAFPIKCERHPNETNYIKKPGQIWQVAPDGGCMLSCGARLNCGHICPYKCHPDDPKHVLVQCHRPCTRLCLRGHPCSKECSTPCGDCHFLSHNVKLPCGHVKKSVPCHMLDHLADIPCEFEVEKKLPQCEHSAKMACSMIPEDYICSKACGRVLGCCGRNCKASCGGCQKENERIEGQEIKRTNHIQHPCQKPRYCAHLCPIPCGPNHKCATTCQERCRQECVHTSCKKHCSIPCAPCMERCTWECPHQQCPVPCGSVCVRLPCDLPCDKTLECGHPCPSACGEDCSIQRCPLCASPDHLNQVVDFIMQRTLADVLEEGDEADILITLPKCGHTFTMETLDGHCGIKEWYTQRNGKWAGLQAPQDKQMGIRKPPVCPTCRQAITSPRYGRIFKAADLHVLNQNIISAMTLQLAQIRRNMDAIPKEDLENKITLATRELKIKIPKPKGNTAQAREAVLASLSETPLDPIHIMPDNKSLFTISKATATKWNSITRPLLTVYSGIMGVANTRSSHVKAWEAAFICLYTREMDQSAGNVTRAPRNPTEHALRMARMTVGLPPPIADKRYLVEAFWASFDVRLLLAKFVISWLKGVQTTGETYPLSERTNVGTFGLFILRSCRVDAQIAYQIAEQSNTRRQMTTTTLYRLRIQFETTRFNVELSRLCGVFKSQEERNRLEEQAKVKMADMIDIARETVHDHCAVLRQDKDTWLEDNFRTQVQFILEEWEKMIHSIKTDTFYEPVSLEEKFNIIKAFSGELTHTGHFYQCPNGHTYVIGECGGAMQASRCPECGAGVGGSNHNLDNTNRRATEFEQMLREAGAEQNPYPWAQ